MLQRGFGRTFYAVTAAICSILVGFSGVQPAHATAPLGASNLLKQTQTQNLPGIDGANSGAYPGSVVYNDRVYYVATSDASGTEVFTSDGTSAGTFVLKEIRSGASSSSPQQLAVANGKLYFYATDGTYGGEPFVSDGTAQGTVLLKDISPNGGYSYARNFTAVGNKVFFAASDSNLASTGKGTELYVTDGTAGGTSLVLDINQATYNYYGTNYAGRSEPTSLTSCNGKLFFVAQDGSHGYELWTSDGTAAGTSMVKDLTTSNDTASSYGDTTNYLSNLTCMDGILYFRGYDPTIGNVLFRSDGTAGGTTAVVNANANPRPYEVNYFKVLNNKLIFQAYDSTNGYELWTSDGTNAGTQVLKNINPSSNHSFPIGFTVHAGKLYFAASDSRGSELWVTDGSSIGTLLVKDINQTAPGSASSPKNMYSWNGKLYFTADDGSNGRELWSSDGTGTGTRLVKDVFPGISDILDVSNYGDNNQPYFAGVSGGLLFTANSPIYSQEMWVTDGTEGGTNLLVDAKVGPGSAYAQNAVAFNGKIYFSASSAYFGHELWSTDLTTGNTQQVIDIYPGAASGLDWNQYEDYSWNRMAKRMAVFNGKLYFTARTASTGWELWSTDGTAAGTAIVEDGYPGANGYGASNLTVCGSNLFFTGYISNSRIQGTTTLYKLGSNGLPQQVITNTSASYPSWDTGTMACTSNGTLMFSAYENGVSPSSGYELWKSDGTASGTVLVKDISTGVDSNGNPNGSDITGMVAVGDRVYFRTYERSTNNYPIWTSDGTTSGTSKLTDVAGYSGSIFTQGDLLVAYNQKLYFNGYSASSGWGLTEYNPSTKTAVNVVSNLSYYKPVVMGGLMWFNGFVAGKGFELMTSDGTSANTGIFEDLNPNSQSSSPTRLAAVGNLLFYNTTDSSIGSQPRYVVGQGINNVTFVSNGSTSGSAPADIAVMAISATVPGNTGNLTRTNYTFTGWNTSPTGFGTQYLPGSTITPIVDTPLYAQWASVQTYTVTYNANGNDGGVAASPVTGISGTIDLDSNSGALTKAGYKFDGWNTLANGTGTGYAAGARYTPTADVTLYAKWTQLPTFSITFNSNETTSGSAPNSLTGVYSTTTLPGVGTMVKSGYTFSGWNTAANGLGTYYAAGETLLPQANLTLYAQWSANANYTLTYDANGATSGSAPSAAVAASTYVVIDNNTGNLRKTGYVFAGWNTAPDGSGTTHLGSNNFLLNSNTTFYAKWDTASYTVSFNSNGSSSGAAPSAINGVQISTTVPGNTGTLEKAGYSFSGWNTLASGLGVDYAANSTISPTGNITLYAKWSKLPTYSITYDGNNASSGGAPVSQTGIYASTILDSNSGNLQKTNYYFAGWNTAADGTGTTYPAGSSFTPSANVTLYALWSANPTYTLSYSGNGNTSGVAPLAQTGITSTANVAQNSGTLKKIGYRFDGWNTLANGTAVVGISGGTGSAYAPTDSITLTSDTVLYAIWTAVPTYTVTFSGNSQSGGSVPQSVTTSDATINLPGNINSMYKTGYSFNGWNTQANGTGTRYAPGEAFPVSSNTTLYVDWLRDTYTVTYNANGSTGGTVPSPTSGSGTLTLAQNTGSLVKTGFIFSGWNTAGDATGTSVAVGGTFTPSGNTTMFAKWTTYTITYNGNGNSAGSVPSSQNGVTALTLATNSGNLAKTNKYFAGWNTQANGLGTTYSESASFTPTANITLYALWSDDPILTLNYSANGATSGSVPAEHIGTVSTQVLRGNTGNLAKSGFTFDGWNTQADGLGTTYAVGATFTYASNTTLYAKWVAVQASSGTASQIYPKNIKLSSNVFSLKGGKLKITGENLKEISKVTVNGVSVPLVSKGDSEAEVSLPPMPAGAYDLVILTAANFKEASVISLVPDKRIFISKFFRENAKVDLLKRKALFATLQKNPAYSKIYFSFANVRKYSDQNLVKKQRILMTQIAKQWTKTQKKTFKLNSQYFGGRNVRDLIVSLTLQ